MAKTLRTPKRLPYLLLMGLILYVLGLGGA
jgi:hypothetical protein